MTAQKAQGKKYDHAETVSCDYQLHDKCWNELPPHKGVPHPVSIWNKKTQEMEDVVKWCCIECEMGFDED